VHRKWQPIRTTTPKKSVGVSGNLASRIDEGCFDSILSIGRVIDQQAVRASVPKEATVSSVVSSGDRFGGN